MGDTFHQTAVTQEHIGVVIHYVVAVAVKRGSQRPFRDGHTHRVGNTLAQRAGRCFHARRITILGMTRRLGMQLTEVLQILNT